VFNIYLKVDTALNLRVYTSSVTYKPSRITVDNRSECGEPWTLM